MMSSIFTLYNRCLFWRSHLWRDFLNTFLLQTFFVHQFYKINDLLWQDGFLFDFLQKKFIDKWLRKFVIYSGYLYSERFLFDWIIRFYLDLVIWSGHHKNIFEFNNIAQTIVVILVFLILFVLVTTLLYLSYCI